MVLLRALIPFLLASSLTAAASPAMAKPVFDVNPTGCDVTGFTVGPHRELSRQDYWGAMDGSGRLSTSEVGATLPFVARLGTSLAPDERRDVDLAAMIDTSGNLWSSTFSVEGPRSRQSLKASKIASGWGDVIALASSHYFDAQGNTYLYAVRTSGTFTRHRLQVTPNGPWKVGAAVELGGTKIGDVRTLARTGPTRSNDPQLVDRFYGTTIDGHLLQVTAPLSGTQASRRVEVTLEMSGTSGLVARLCDHDAALPRRVALVRYLLSGEVRVIIVRDWTGTDNGFITEVAQSTFVTPGVHF